MKLKNTHGGCSEMQREQQQKNLLLLAASSNNASAITQTAKDAQNADLLKFSVPEEYPVGIDLAEALKHPGSDADMICERVTG